MASTEEITATIEAHVAAVGAADADEVASLYGAEAELQDPAGTTARWDGAPQGSSPLARIACGRRDGLAAP